MTTPPNTQDTIAYQSLKMSNFLALKAFQSKNQQSLIFLILNDTFHMIRYDRALLWEMTQETPQLLGISGESKINKSAPLVQKWTAAVKDIKDPSRAQIMTFSGKESKDDAKASLLWLPIVAHGSLTLGLWLELWDKNKDNMPPQEMINMLTNFLLPAYGAAWEKHSKHTSHKKTLLKKITLYSIALASFIAVFTIQVPLRIVAPCEIVPKDPYLITAPLEGIIDQVYVVPGETVSPETLLFSYNKQASLQELEVAKKQVQILQTEIKRAAALGYDDPKARTDLGLLSLKLSKEKAVLQLAEYHASKLSAKAPVEGVIMIDNPDEWRGKPVKIGEKILAISNPLNSKIRIWLAESDNITLDWEKPLSVFLNVDPENKRLAKLSFISNESRISDMQIPSFMAEADWIKDPLNIRLGQKGTAVIYGEDVSIAYFLFRKPLAHLRNLTGL